MHLLCLTLLTTLGSAFPEVPPSAAGRSPIVEGRAAVTARLLVHDAAAVPGEPLRLGVHLELAPGWHVYGQHPGGAGFPLSLEWDVPDATLAPVRWPPPQTFHESDSVTTYGYSRKFLLGTTATPARHAGPAREGGEHLHVAVRLRYLACNIVCSPGEVTLTRDVPIGRTAQPVGGDTQAAFAAADAQPELALDAADVEATPALITLARALLLALIGGLVLNLMPCVLPVLALKAVALARASHTRRTARLQALAYVAGVVGSMLTLAGAVVGLRAAGHSVGWGFQFQEPGFIAALAVFMLLFACSCLGLFELAPELGQNRVAQAHASAQGLRRSALEGVLAVLVATPCSAPFLGTAVAFALAQPGQVVALIFAAIGVGLALPWAALTLVPSLARALPRPGAWMLHLKLAMGHLLLGTCIWLVWLYARACGVDAGAALAVLLWLAVAGAWIAGRVAAEAPARLWPALGVLLLLLGGAGRLLLAPATGGDDIAQAAPFSEAAVQAELAQGHPVFVDFTADWCITCKYNERHVLQDPAVRTAMARRHVTVLRADWTRRDPQLLAILMQHGRAGVPMYLLYWPERPTEPVLLPELLRTQALLADLAQP